MTKGGKRRRAGRPRICAEQSKSHTFNIDARLYGFFKALGKGKRPFPSGARRFVALCEEMCEVYLPGDRPEEASLLFANLNKLNAALAGFDMHTGGLHTDDRGNPRSFRLPPDMRKFLSDVGGGNVREGLRRLDDLIYITLGSLDEVVMGKYPEYDYIWLPYKELLRGYIRQPFGKVRIASRRDTGREG